MTTWVKVYNSMPAHPKFLIVGGPGGWLFVCGLCYANEHLTDGFVPAHVLPVVAPGLRRVETVAARLVGAGLWHKVDGGWQIHDYDDHQRSADEIKDRRERDRERKSGVRKDSTRTPRGKTPDSTRNPAGLHSESTRSPQVVRDLDVEGRRQKAEETTSKTDPKIHSLCQRLAGHIRANDPKADPKPDSERWLTDMRLLVADRGGDVAEVGRIIDWSQTSGFWRSNILSPAKLRKQFTQLLLKAEGREAGAGREERRTRGSAALDGLIRASQEGGAAA